MSAVPSGLTRPVVVLSLSRLVEAMGNGFVVIAIPISVAALPHDGFPFPEHTRVGIVISLFGLVLGLAQPLVGRLTERRLHTYLFGGLALFFVSTLGLAAAQTFGHLVALRALQGLAIAFVIPPTLALVALHAGPHKRGGAMGFYGMARMMGFGLGPIIGGLVMAGVSGGAVYLAAAVPSLIAGALVFFGVPRRTPGPVAHPTHDTVPTAPVSREIRTYIALASTMFACACSLSVMAVLENEFISRHGQSELEFGIAFSAAVIVRVFFDWPLGRLSDRIGRKPLIVPGLLLLAPLTVLMAFAPNTEWLIVVRIAMGFAMGCVSPAVFAMASDHAPPGRTASRMSWVTSGFAMGLAVGPLLTGWWADTSGFATPFWVFGGLSLVAGVFVQLAAREAPLKRTPSVGLVDVTEE